MHPTAARELPADQAGWAFEPKWDGYRALGHLLGGELALRSRNGVDMAGWFPELGPLARALGGHAAVLDGEVVALDQGGRPSFGALQQRMAGRGGRRRGAAVSYLVFDLLWLDGRLLTGLPYAERRRLLEELAVAGPAWQTVASFAGAGSALLAATREQGLEGVVAKKLQSTYVPGRRTRNWLKTKHYQRETFLVGGFVPDYDQVRSLLVGLPDPGRPGGLVFSGRVDHGLVPAARRRVGELLGPLVTPRARSPSPAPSCSAAAGPGPAPKSKPRCSSAPSWPSRSASSAGSRAACATLPTAASPGYCRGPDPRGGFHMTDELAATARALVAPGKGILAADESSGTIKKRFASIEVESTEEHRRDYRELLFTTEGAAEFISGVILYDETLRQRAADGTPLAEVLSGQGIICGIKVDAGTTALAGFPGEKVTQGLDGLDGRLAEYRELGARFTKWRAVITIGEHIPSDGCIRANAEALGRFAASSQAAGLVPIVEPEVLMDGDHPIERCDQASRDTLATVFAALRRHRVRLDGILLKPNMVLSGSDCPTQAGAAEVAAATLACLRDTVPASVPGIVFLSGGQSDQAATANLNAMNRLGGAPWQLSFSYGRALQAPALKAWKGEPANRQAAQRAFYHRARLNGAARSGSWTEEMETADV